MIDFYYAATPNGWKVAILLEELGLDYRMIPVRLSQGDQFKPEFLAISPNNRMPAIVDHDVEGDPVPVFESGAIMWYLAEKTGRFLPSGALERKEVMEWLFWQVGNQGPMAGQLSHFVNYAPEGVGDYGRARYAREYDRCLGVLDRRLEGRDWIVGGEYSIADMICWPWVLIAKPLGADLAPFPNLAAWRQRVKERPAVQRAVDLGKELRRNAPPDEAERRLLFEQTAASVRARPGGEGA
ncbi:MAG TPA: glutathione S-transferase N-terminal domain-containing protein [Thermohalobaculum sp.]|nr:glutathione S-transferase N-terminal domain-containing protein [Thermohalobaculum sp.]